MDIVAYNTARIDIKNFGSYNNIDILQITENSKIEYPNWFNDKRGVGVVITNTSGSINIKIKCIKSGDIYIYTRNR